jgi:syntaxin-binding protein 1
VVENVAVPRQPAPHLSGIYFISPTDDSVRALLADFSRARGPPQYKAVHVYFSSAADPRHVAAIRDCPRLLSRLGTLKEVNLEYLLYPDNRSFTTAQDGALGAFFGAGVDSSERYRADVEATATRLATVFTTMKEFPSIRYRAALPPGEEYPPGLESRLLVAQRLAVELHERLGEAQRAGQVPERETCELVITDRGFDPVAPVIHEWTYQAMVHDLLEGSPALKGKVFSFESHTQGGRAERRDAVLDERDALFGELRHRHFADASLRISARMDELARRSRAAPHAAAGVRDLDLRAMAKLVQALPQYRDQLAALGVHVELASVLNRLIEQHRLADVGKVEQDLVYGDATSKEVIALLSANQMLPAADKLRLLMCYSATHQEKLDATRAAQWQKVARLSAADMATLTNLELLGVPVVKRRGAGGLGAITFGRMKRRRALRKDREPDEDDQRFALTRFVPLLAEVVEDAASGRLSQDEYPYVRPPSSPSAAGGGLGAGVGPLGAAAAAEPGFGDAAPNAAVASFRTVRSATGQWARKAGLSGGAGGGAGASGSGGGRGGEFGSYGGRGGSRIFAFIIGGFTMSELRVAHRLSAKLGRDVVLGGTSVETPAKFMAQLLALEPAAEVGSLEIESLSVSGGTPRHASASSTPRKRW